MQRGLDQFFSRPDTAQTGRDGLIIVAMTGIILGAYFLVPDWLKSTNPRGIDDILPAIFLATAFGFLCWRIVSTGIRPILSMALTLFAVWPSVTGFSSGLSPLSLLLFVVWRECLSSRNLAKPATSVLPLSWPVLVVLPAISVLWANMDAGGLIGGLILLATYTVGACRDDRSTAIKLGLALALCAALSLVNPDGYRLLWFGWKSFWSGRTINFQSAEARGFLVWLGVLFVTLAWRRLRLRSGEALALVGWTGLALFSRDNIPFMVIVTAPVLGKALVATNAGEAEVASATEPSGVEAVPAGRRRWWWPSHGVMLWLLLFVMVAMSPWRARLISADGDAALHWRLGAQMLERRAVLRTDEASFTRPGAAVVSKEWLSECLWGAMGQVFGWNGLVWLAGILIATTMWLLYRQMTAEGSDLLTATLLVLVAALGCALHWLARPLLFTHLLVVVFNGLLRGYERGRVPGWKLFLWLPAAMALWANLHGGFPVGMVLVGIYFCGSCWRRDVVKARTLAGVGLACGAATFLNPNGWRLHEVILRYLRDPRFVGEVNEFLAVDFHRSDAAGFAVGLMVLAIVLVAMRRRWEATDVMLVGVWGWFALHSVRNVPVFGLVLVPVCAAHWRAIVSPAAYRRVAESLKQVNAGGDGRLWVAVALAVGLAGLVRTEPLPGVFPSGAVEYLRRHPEVAGGRMFNLDWWGGYLMLEMPGRKVFVDSRHEFYGAELLGDYDRVMKVEPGCLEVLRRYGVEWTILPAGHPLNRLLEGRAEWRLVYSDPVASVFARGR